MTSPVDVKSRAQSNPIELNRPSPRFMDAALNGNGQLGVLVRARPDAVCLHFGHTAVWDIRHGTLQPDARHHFQWVFDYIWNSFDGKRQFWTEKDWQDYTGKLYQAHARPYPCPFPCGTLVLGIDRRRTEVLGWTVRIHEGQIRVRLLDQGRNLEVVIFCSMESDLCRVTVRDDENRPAPSPFNRIHLIPDVEPPPALPQPVIEETDRSRTLSFVQRLPYLEPPAEVDVCPSKPYNAVPGFAPDTPPPRIESVEAQSHPRDRFMRLSIHGHFPCASSARPYAAWNGVKPSCEPLERHLAVTDTFDLCVRLEHGFFNRLKPVVSEPVSPEAVSKEIESTSRAWANYWNASAVSLPDEPALEKAWYHGLYFLRCTVHPQGTYPGLYGNWMLRRAGSVWHGDYHMNYNAQQPLWGMFSANHAELHESYLDMVEQHLPLARKHAREYFGLPGAAFPHTSFPIGLEEVSPTSPDMGWEMCETPWWVQSLWWHYCYTGDRELLKKRLWPILREAAIFMTAYIQRAATLPGVPQDGKAHIYPTVPPELYCHTFRFDRNMDCLADLTLTKFLFNACLDSVRILELGQQESGLVTDIQSILERYPAYPTADTPAGPVLVSVSGEDPDIVYNCPISTMSLFPGEEHGLSTASNDPGTFDLLRRTYERQYNEGGNDLVHLHLQAARLGMLDLDKFKRQLEYCLLPNGTWTDMVMQAGGRYSDLSEFDFMERLGVWVENFSVFAVINECLMQSWDGIIRLFPNWNSGHRASFHNLRAKGAFLVSASYAEGKVISARFFSETDNLLKFYHPAPGQQIILRDARDGRILVQSAQEIVECPLKQGQECLLEIPS